MIFRQIKIEKFNSEINKNNMLKKVANFNQLNQLENFKHEK